MKRWFAVIPFCLLLCVIGAFIAANPLYRGAVHLARVEKGTVAIESVGDITELRGGWSFWWKRFVTDIHADIPDSWAPLPGSWASVGVADKFGFASWGVTVSGLDPKKTYAICVGQTLSACSIVVNGIPVAGAGKNGSSKAEEIPEWKSILGRFEPHADGTADIILQVSNYRDRTGGTNSSVYVGEASLLARMQDAQKMADVFIFSILAVMGLFFLMLFVSSPINRYFLWFGLFALMAGFRALCYDGFVLLDFFPALPWTVFFRIGYLTVPVLVICFLGLVTNLYPSVQKRKVALIAMAPFIAYVPVILAAPEVLVSLLLFPVQLCAIAAMALGMYSIFRAALRRESLAWPIFASFSLAILAFLYDILVSMWLIPGYSFGPVGSCGSLFAGAFLVLDFYSTSFERTRELSERLQSANHALKKFVPADVLALLDRESFAEVRAGDEAEVEMAILSADIRSFAAIAERLEPAAVFAFLNEFFGLAGPIIRSNAGFIARYEGDGFLALFPHGAESAVRTAVQIQSAISGRNRAHPGRPQLTVGIGIDVGKLKLGTIGDDSRLDSAVFSNSIRCAGKYEAATKEFHSRILINDAVFSGLYDPLAWFLRPIERIDTGERMAFLFEVYNNDPEIVRELKWKTQGDLEHALFAFYAGRTAESRTYLSRALSVFPDDPVLRYYDKRLR